MRISFIIVNRFRVIQLIIFTKGAFCKWGIRVLWLATKKDKFCEINVCMELLLFIPSCY